MTLLERMPETRRGRGLTLAAAAVVWFAVYQLNEHLWDWVLYNGFGMDPTARVTETIHFFIYDTIKITLLLVLIIFIVTFLRSYMSVERTRALLGGKREGVGNVMAAGLGVVTPFCSCSAVPAFIGFVAAGVPIGVTLSFLIASPMVNEIAIGMLLTLFGVKITAIYVGTGLVIAIVAGWILGRLGVQTLGRAVRLRDQAPRPAHRPRGRAHLRRPHHHGRRGGRHRPAQDLALPARRHRPRRGHPRLGARPSSSPPTPAPDPPSASWSRSAIGIPLYSNAAGIMPLVQALYEKGLPMGTLLAFMMAVVALSLPEMILLRRVLKPQLLAAYVGVVGTGIVIVGYLFNFLLAT